MPLTLLDPRPEIESVRAEAKAAGVQKGAQILAINGRPFAGVSQLYAPVRNARAGDSLRVEVRDKGASQSRQATIVLAADRSRSPSTEEWIVDVLIGIFTPLLCVLLGFFVAAVRIRDPLAWILLFVLLGFSEQSGSSLYSLYGHDDWFQPITIVYHQSLANGWPIAMMLFGLYFPERFEWDRRRPWLKWIWLVPVLLHLVLNTAMRLFEAQNIAAAIPIASLLDPLDRPLFVFGMLGISFFFAATGSKLGQTKNPDARRRLKLLHVGALISLTPVFGLVITDFILKRPRFGNTPGWLLAVIFLCLSLFPIVLAYLILVERALDVRVVIRQSLRYLLATSTVRFIQIGLTVSVIFGIVVMLADPASMLNRPHRIQLIAEGIAVVFLLRRLAESLRRWIDRRFFREAYNADLILSDLADKVRTIVDTDTLLETVAKRIAESLHVTRVALLLPAGGSFAPVYCLGYGEPPRTLLPENGSTIEHLHQERAATVYPDDNDSWIYQPNFPEPERIALESLESQLLLPLALNQKILGILSLGPKQSEAPYSSDDVRLLGSVATQTGLALENSRLTTEIANEVAQRERVNRELEIAREVQERLFPQELPQFPGLDYAGSCRPALGVGGDYYDFIQLSETELGIAIGDVSGKGIPAALLMASLRASLRGQIIRHEPDLAQLMSNVNTLIYEGSTSNRYATFFYAQYNTSTRVLTYVNAGHNPPLILRQPSEVIHLEASGPVVGMLPNLPYEQSSVTLKPGDMVVAFTDGISESMNSNGDEWGEDQLIRSAWTCTSLPAEKAMRRLVVAADEFAAGARQHDDMTIVVLQVK
jgi:sigma-B regulation protein RsbU (phosphoserine phosphatase)